MKTFINVVQIDGEKAYWHYYGAKKLHQVLKGQHDALSVESFGTYHYGSLEELLISLDSLTWQGEEKPETEQFLKAVKSQFIPSGEELNKLRIVANSAEDPCIRLVLAYQLGKNQGKREERKRRKKGNKHAPGII